jgi:hypothetical protein
MLEMNENGKKAMEKQVKILHKIAMGFFSIIN